MLNIQCLTVSMRNPGFMLLNQGHCKTPLQYHDELFWRSRAIPVDGTAYLRICMNINVLACDAHVLEFDQFPLVCELQFYWSMYLLNIILNPSIAGRVIDSFVNRKTAHVLIHSPRISILNL